MTITLLGRTDLQVVAAVAGPPGLTPAAAAAAVAEAQAFAAAATAAASSIAVPSAFYSTKFTGAGQTSFTFPGAPAAVEQVFMSIGGVMQAPGTNLAAVNTDYILTGAVLSFAAIPAGEVVLIWTSTPFTTPLNTDYASRATLVAAIAAGMVPINGIVYRAGRLKFLGQMSATNIADLPGLVPDGDLSPDHFIENTTPGTTDTLVGWTRMRAYMASSGVNEVSLYGPYLVSAPIVFSTFSAKLVSVRGFISEIRGSHTTGPIVHFRKSFCASTGVRYISVGARLTATYGALNAGILIGDFDWTNPTVGAGTSGALCEMKHNIVRLQPGPGILNFGGGAIIELNSTTNNAGHGIQVDAGGLIGVNSSTIGFPGWGKISQNQVFACGGHGVVVGNVIAGVQAVGAGTQPPYRYDIYNNDVGSCATDAAVRFSAHQIYVMGEQINTDINVCHSSNAGPGMYVAGKQQKHTNNRFVEITGHAYEVGDVSGFGSSGITIDEFRLNSVSPSLNPAIVIAAALLPSDGIYIKQSDQVSITQLIGKTFTNKVTQVIYADMAIVDHLSGVFSLPLENRNNGTAGMFRIEPILTAETKQSIRVDILATSQASGFSARGVVASYLLSRNAGVWTSLQLVAPNGNALGDLTVSLDLTASNIATINSVIANADASGPFSAEIRVQGRNYKVTLL